MKEIIIPVEFANAVDFYGVNDANLDIVRRRYAEVKIIARGQELKLIGEPNLVSVLEKL